MMTDPESSSEEEDSRLKEALDPHMFNKEAMTAIKDTKESRKVKSNYKDNILNVTPEFQSYVAKHLSDTLDKTIEEYEGKAVRTKWDCSSGIRLFKCSQELLTAENFREWSGTEYPKESRRKKRKHESEAALLEKARSVAVSPEWVLEKQGIREWCKPKGKEIRTKLNAAGELEIVEPPFVSK